MQCVLSPVLPHSLFQTSSQKGDPNETKGNEEEHSNRSSFSSSSSLFSSVNSISRVNDLKSENLNLTDSPDKPNDSLHNDHCLVQLADENRDPKLPRLELPTKHAITSHFRENCSNREEKNITTTTTTTSFTSSTSDNDTAENHQDGNQNEKLLNYEHLVETCNEFGTIYDETRKSSISFQSPFIQSILSPLFIKCAKERYIQPIYDEQNEQVILPVECGFNHAFLYLTKLCQGSKGACVLFKSYYWLTPNEFQYLSGRESAKDWKR